MSGERGLIDKLKRIQALYRGATTAGERTAAHEAYRRVSERLEQERRIKPVEHKFSLSDRFQRRLFTALARKHGLEPYRYKRQRRTTVMLWASRQFVDDVLKPEFDQLSETLFTYLSDVTERVIAEAVHPDPSDVPVTGELGSG